MFRSQRRIRLFLSKCETLDFLTKTINRFRVFGIGYDSVSKRRHFITVSGRQSALHDTNLSPLQRISPLKRFIACSFLSRQFTRRALHIATAMWNVSFVQTMMIIHAPSFRQSCFRPTFFVQSISSNPIRLG